MEFFNYVRSGIIGNRITLSGTSLTLSSLLSMSVNSGQMDYTKSLLENIAFFIGISFLGLTDCGSETAKCYNRTINHIEDNDGKIDESYLKVHFYRSSKLFGYCVDQGIFLAAKEKILLPEFRSAQKKYSKNIIPTF